MAMLTLHELHGFMRLTWLHCLTIFSLKRPGARFMKIVTIPISAFDKVPSSISMK